eukprot:TRINITY_DN115_c3_g1_i1.p1 TRINITY_DN115_c3_g1~~TRINITY_DN115_c3_g1_i1.p1  ORF type:complete len:626 (-),score=268.49 TRINITY_DN115_c3_g1_i1:88-1965(-)
MGNKIYNSIVSLPENSTLKDYEKILNTNILLCDQATAAEIASATKNALEQYPYLKTVFHNSALLTRADTASDNHIIWVNDNFERMTLYCREEIVGRNCRFLQGKFTNKDTVLKIRDAIKNFTEVEVEILNYRKDGIPFWNRFKILPVKNEKKITTHFLAIQEDITLIKQNETNVYSWSAPEVCMWLEYIDMGKWAISFLENDIKGEELLELEEDDLRQLSVTAVDCDCLLEQIFKLRENPRGAYSKQSPTSSTDDLVQWPRKPRSSNNNNNNNNSNTASGRSTARNEFLIDLPSKNNIRGDNASDSSVGSHTHHTSSSSSLREKSLAIKCYSKHKTEIIILKPHESFKKLKRRFQNLHPNVLVDAFYHDSEGNLFPLNNSDDFKKFLLTLEGNTLKVSLKPKRTKIPADQIAWLDTLAPAIVIIEPPNWNIVYSNISAQSLLGYRSDDAFEINDIFPSLQLKLFTDAYQNGGPSFAKRRDGSTFNTWIWIRNALNGTFSICFFPFDSNFANDLLICQQELDQTRQTYSTTNTTTAAAISKRKSSDSRIGDTNNIKSNSNSNSNPNLSVNSHSNGHSTGHSSAGNISPISSYLNSASILNNSTNIMNPSISTKVAKTTKSKRKMQN